MKKILFTSVFDTLSSEDLSAGVATQAPISNKRLWISIILIIIIKKK